MQNNFRKVNHAYNFQNETRVEQFYEQDLLITILGTRSRAEELMFG
jgi:hypothetical protein